MKVGRGGDGSHRLTRKERGPAKEKPCLCGNCLFSLAECKTIFEENSISMMVKDTQ